MTYALLVGGWLAGALLLWRVPVCRDPVTGTSAHGRLPVAVEVAARNEEATLPRLLASLRAQQPAPLEVVVADDSSGDATAGVARDAGVTVVACGDLPVGWTGKAWACQSGAAATAAPALVFLDADCELEPGGLARIVGEHRRRGGLVSVQPFHATRRPHEALSAFFNLVSMMGVGAFTALGERVRPGGAFGPCLVATRADYDAVGGHRAVRGEIVEDVALAERFTSAGMSVSCLGGRGSIRFRMYPHGLAQLAEGWTKNIASGAASARPALLAPSVVWVAGCIVAATAGLGSVPPGAAVAAYTAYGGQIAWMLRRVGRFPAWAWAGFPVPLAAFLVLFTRSLVRTGVRREVTWRGRRIPTGGR